MAVELDTFLVALYTIMDERYQQQVAAQRPVRRGQRPLRADSELLTLVVCAQWYGRSERHCLRLVARSWGSAFPRLLGQSAFKRRGRDLTGVLTQLIPLVAAELGATLARYQVRDGVAMPLARRTRGIRHRLFADEAGIGRGGADKDGYFGCKVLLSCTPRPRPAIREVGGTVVRPARSGHATALASRPGLPPSPTGPFEGRTGPSLGSATTAP